MIDKSKGILVTGANGLLGSHILQELTNQGYLSISGLVRSGADMSLVSNKTNIKWAYGDILDIFSLEDAMQGISYVIHCAGLVSYNLKRANEIYKVNEEGTANVVNVATHMRVEKVVHISSIAALGKSKISMLINEDALWTNSPYNTVYAKSKYLAEQQVWRSYYEGLPMTILNPSIILGVGNWELTSLKFLPKISSGNKFYPLGSTGYVDVIDVAKCAVLSIDKKYDGERYIISGHNLSFKNFFTLVSKSLGTKAPTIAVNNWLAGIGWRIDWLKNYLFDKEPLLTKETAASSSLEISYDSSKSIEAFEIRYRDIHVTVDEMVQAYLSE